MSQPLAPESHERAVPRFYVTPRPRFNPVPFCLALVVAIACLFAVLYALNHTGHQRLFANGGGGSRSGAGGAASGSSEDDDSDPSTVDTIYLGDPTEAPTTTRPATQPTSDSPTHTTTVHPFVVVKLPRSGDQVGQIPDSPTGHLLYNWLAAINGKDPSAVATALTTPEPSQTEAAQLQLRKLTGGFTLISAKEVQPGLLVFRLHDQTPSFTEFLGTLQARPDSIPPGIASFSLGAVTPAHTIAH